MYHAFLKFYFKEETGKQPRCMCITMEFYAFEETTLCRYKGI